MPSTPSTLKSIEEAVVDVGMQLPMLTMKASETLHAADRRRGELRGDDPAAGREGRPGVAGARAVRAHRRAVRADRALARRRGARREARRDDRRGARRCVGVHRRSPRTAARWPRTRARAWPSCRRRSSRCARSPTTWSAIRLRSCAAAPFPRTGRIRVRERPTADRPRAARGGVSQSAAARGSRATSRRAWLPSRARRCRTPRRPARSCACAA